MRKDKIIEIIDLFRFNEVIYEEVKKIYNDKKLTEEQLVRYMLIGFYNDFRVGYYYGGFNTKKENKIEYGNNFQKRKKIFNKYFGKEINNPEEFKELIDFRLMKIEESTNNLLNFVITGNITYENYKITE